MTEYTNNYSLSNELLSFKKSIGSNNRQAIEKYLTLIKNVPQDFLNQALFWCIENYKVQTDQCLHILLRYTSEASKSKANPNCQINLQTPLIAACKKGQLQLVKRLIENGAKPDQTNSQNKHPLQFILMSREQNYDVAEYLISQMHTVNFLINNKHPILISVERQFHRIFKSLLEKGSQIVFEDENLLHFIMKQKFKKINKKKKILKQLTNKYVLFTQVDKNGKIPIDYQENEQIRVFYAENFKVKKTPQPVMNSLEKISNNSSIFINLKSNKKDGRQNINERKKNITQLNQSINKQQKDNIKQAKNTGKQSKQDEASFEEEIQDKQDSQNNQEDERVQQKQTKINNQISNLNPGKKTGLNVSKGNQNSSYSSNNVNFTAKDQASSTSNTIGGKLRSKYSFVGPKTQTYLKSSVTTSRRGNENVNRNEGKKNIASTNTGNVTKQVGYVKKKKSSFEDQKKDIGSSRKINTLQMKSNINKDQQKNDRAEKQDQNLKQEKQEQNQNKAQKAEQAETTVNEVIKSDQSLPAKDALGIEESINKEQEKYVQKDPKQSQVDEFKHQKLSDNFESNKKEDWEIALESCQKLMEQFIIKEQNQITHLNQLKQKINQVFIKYQAEKSQKQNEIKFSESQKINEIKLPDETINKSKKSIKSQNPNSSKLIPSTKSLFPNSLSQQISQIERKSQNSGKQKSACIYEAIQMITLKIQNVLQSSRKEKIEVSIETYGSRANGLEIQTSDIDLLIICNINSGVKDLMLQLQRSGAFNCSQINQAKFLANTSMPIMKLSLNSKFMHLNIDLTFQVRGHTGLRCTSLIKQFIAAQQLLKPLVVTLKTLLSHYGLCDTYTGGVGSYSLTLMTIALLQFTEIRKTRQNLGQIFLQFLLFYGFQMDYVCQAIIIHPPGFNERPAFSIYQLPYSLDLTPKLIIYDPLNPVNNVGRATYRIVQLKKLFKIWYVKLNTELSGQKDAIQKLMKMKDELLRRTAII